jgi:hypothetical protein
MLEKISALWSDGKERDLALVAGGMVLIMTGAKVAPSTMFALGLRGLEKRWRKEHPEFGGDLGERWRMAIDHYEATHEDGVNRALHTIGIPMIVLGAAGLLAAPRYSPPWWVANGSYATGWALNFIGHGFFEKGAPAFAEDPLSFIAGPAWDFVRIKDTLAKMIAGEAPLEDRAPHTETAPAPV